MCSMTLHKIHVIAHDEYWNIRKSGRIKARAHLRTHLTDGELLLSWNVHPTAVSLSCCFLVTQSFVAFFKKNKK